MSTHNIGFYEDLTKITRNLSPGFRPCPTQTGLYSHSLKFWIKEVEGS